MTHFGTNTNALCGESALLGGRCTADFNAVDCTKCLWQLFAETMKAADRVAFRLKLLTDEKASKVIS